MHIISNLYKLCLPVLFVNRIWKIGLFTYIGHNYGVETFGNCFCENAIVLFENTPNFQKLFILIIKHIIPTISSPHQNNSNKSFLKTNREQILLNLWALILNYYTLNKCIIRKIINFMTPLRKHELECVKSTLVSS